MEAHIHQNIYQDKKYKGPQVFYVKDNKKLAELTKMDFDTVTVAMELLKKIGLIEILENGEISRKKLGNLVFFDENLRKKLENVIYPKYWAFILHYRQKDLSLSPKKYNRDIKQCVRL